MQATDHRFQNKAEALAYALAGNATLTLQSARSGQHYTYKVRAAKDRETGEPTPGRYFVTLLTDGNADEGEFTYLGMVQDGKFFATRASAHMSLKPSFKAFSFFFNQAELHPELVVFHTGRCGRCGRTLTVPESIQAGIGPECAQMMS
jgi:hypothetical protein